MKYLLMYVHFPDYESKGLATTFVVNRCLGGLVLMQLTCMGVLALKAADKEDDKDHSSSEWSQYAQMVFGILPLLAMTFFLFTLINQAAKRQIRNVPIEIIGKVQRHFARMFAQRKREGADAAPPNEFSAAQQDDSRLLNRLSVFGATDSSVSLSLGDDAADPTAATSTTMENGSRPKFSLRRFFQLPQLQSPFPENPEEDPLLQPVQQQHTSYDLVEDEDDGSSDEVALMESHLEPPMTRCYGVLNIPLGGSLLRYGEQDVLEGMYEDGQLHTYYHPALIGKLPVAWFKGDVFQDLRQNQEREQRLLMSRLQSQQRLAVDEDLEDEEHESRFKSFFDIFDGLASIVHLTIF